MISNHHKNIATFIHLSIFSRFIIPFGNFVVPIILWITNREKSEFVDAHGKQAINFQISVLLYAVVLAALTIPILLFNVFGNLNIFDGSNFENIHVQIMQLTPLVVSVIAIGCIAIAGFILEMVLIVVASLKARDGEYYKYPLTINFLK